MPEKVAIFVESAPKPFGHYSQAIKLGNTLHISGQLPLDPVTNRPIQGDIKEQSRQVLRNITTIMQSCGGALSNILCTRLYLVDLRDFPAFDEVSREFFFFLPPARTTIPVPSLPGGCRICLEAIAELNPSEVGGPKML